MDVDSLNRAGEQRQYGNQVTAAPISKAISSSNAGSKTIAEGMEEKTTLDGQQRNDMSVRNGNGKDSDAKALTKSEKAMDEITNLDSKLTEEFMKKTVDQINKVLFDTNRQFSYDIHEATHRIMIKVVDSRTKEVISEIPPEKTLDAVAKMWELSGLFVDEKK